MEKSNVDIERMEPFLFNLLMELNNSKGLHLRIEKGFTIVSFYLSIEESYNFSNSFRKRLHIKHKSKGQSLYVHLVFVTSRVGIFLHCINHFFSVSFQFTSFLSLYFGSFANSFLSQLFSTRQITK